MIPSVGILFLKFASQQDIVRPQMGISGVLSLPWVLLAY